MIQLLVILGTLLGTSASAQTYSTSGYFSIDVCNALMNRTAGQTYASVVAPHVTTREQAYEMLIDHQLIFSAVHNMAVYQWLKERNVTGLDKKSLTAALKQEADFSGKFGRQKNSKILATIQNLTESTTGPAVPANDLARVMATLPQNHPLNEAFLEYTRATFEMNYAASLNLKLQALNERADRLMIGRMNEQQRQKIIHKAMVIGGGLAFAGFITTMLIDADFFLKAKYPILNLAGYVGLLLSPIYFYKYRDKWLAKQLKVTEKFVREETARYHLSIAGQSVQPSWTIGTRPKGFAVYSGVDLTAAADREHILNLKPFDVEYLSDAEITQAQNLVRETQALLEASQQGKSTQAQNVADAADALLDAPDSVEAQNRLRLALVSLESSLNLPQIEANMQNTSRRLGSLRQAITRLRQLPYGVSNAVAAKEVLPIGLFLLNRLERTISSFSEVESQASHREQALLQLQQNRAELQRLIQQTPADAAAWTALAEDALLTIELF